jgi:uncharacterized protein (TIGR03790 family)
MRMQRVWSWCIRATTALGLIALAAGDVLAQGPANVLVVANAANADSVKIAEAYAKARDIPPEQILKLENMPANAPEQIPAQAFQLGIQVPIARWLAKNAAFDRILYIVLTKGIPLRVLGSTGRNGSVASVDSELTLLYRSMSGGRGPGTPGPQPNPYFLNTRPVSEAAQFNHRDHDIYLVTRLDGYTVDDVLRLIERGRSPAADGRFVLDMKASLNPAGNAWLQSAAERLQAAGWSGKVVLDQTSRVLTGEPDVLGYYSWGSNDPAITIRDFQHKFVPGALAGMFVSSDGRTMKEPPAEWKIGPWGDAKTYFENSPQSLAADLIRQGVTGAAGHVAEPYLDTTIRPDILFPAYVAGFNLAEAYYLAMPAIGWQTIVIGDPLCAPFRKASMTDDLLNPAPDPATEMSGFFSARRFAQIMRPGYNEEGVKWSIRSEMRLARGDNAGQIEALETAIRLEPRLSSSQMALALLHEREQDYDKAIERYRAIIANDDRNVAALNNLAFALAVRKQLPKEALPLAQRAYLLTREQALTGDTLAWVYHLLGDDKTALPLLQDAARRVPQHAEIRWHLGAVLAGVGQIDLALQTVEMAIRLNPDLQQNAEVSELRDKLRKKIGKSP